MDGQKIGGDQRPAGPHVNQPIAIGYVGTPAFAADQARASTPWCAARPCPWSCAHAFVPANYYRG